MILSQLDNILNDFSYTLRQRGMNIQNYMQMTGQDERTLAAQFRPQAETNTKCGIIFDKIVKLEGLELDEGELNAEYARLAETYRMGEEEIRKSVPEKSLAHDLLALKASKLITSTAVRLDKPEEETAPEVKVKPKAKKTVAKKSTKSQEEE
jgi:trigger factor